MKKKLISLFLCLTMIFSICIPVYAAGNTLTATADKTAICGATTATVTVHAKTGEAVKALGVKVEFDSTLLTLTKATPLVSQSYGTMVETYDSTKNSLACMLSTAATVDCDVIALTFKTTAEKAGKATVTITPSFKNGSTSLECAAATVELNLHSPKAAVKENEKAATCCAKGSYDEVVYCALCNAKLSSTPKELPIDPDAHKWGEWKVTKEATETTEGVSTRICELNAEHKETKSIPVLNHEHDMKAVAAKAATCTEAGNKAYWQCSKCLKYFSDKDGKTETTLEAVTIKALGHDPQAVKAVAATCTTAGNKAYYKCSRCSALFEDAKAEKPTTADAVKIAALDHDLKPVAAVAATCTTAGNKAYYKCSRCGALFEDAAGKTPTTLDKVTIKALGHKMTKTEGKAATCTTEGLNPYWYCSTCKKYYSDAAGTKETTPEKQVIKALGHNVVSVAEKPATCTATGVKAHYECTRCGTCYSDNGKTEIKKESLTIAALGHKIVSVPEVAATCTIAGVKAHYKCERCGALFEDKDGKESTTKNALTIKALGHEFKDGKCIRCGILISDVDENRKAPDYNTPAYTGGTSSGSSSSSSGSSSSSSGSSSSGSGSSSSSSNSGSAAASVNIENYSIKAVNDGTNGCELTWDAVPGAESFNLYANINGSLVFIKNLGKATAADIIVSSSGKTYVSTGGNYTIYKYDEANGVMKKSGTLSADKIDTIARANNITENFMIKPVVNGKENADNNSYTVSFKAYYKPAPTVTAESGSILLKWKKVPGATKYKVYKYVDGKLKVLVETTKRSVRLKNTTAGETYIFAVKAYVDGQWTKLYKSDLVSVKAK